MSKQANETNTAPAPAITRERVRAIITEIVEAMGCPSRKAISTEEFQVITLILLERLAGASRANRDAALAVLKLADANASAMRQRLYESKQAAASSSQVAAAAAAKYSGLA